MNPIIVNCVVLYLTVILLSLLQSRFRLFKDDPATYLILVIIMPFLILGKAKGIKTWTGLTGIEIFGYTLFVAYLNAKSILPKINEGYIYAYTLFHWYLLYDTINLKGFNTFLVIILLISIYPTFLIIKSSFEFKVLKPTSKIVLYYWFLFTIAFTYIDQVALEIVDPILALSSLSFKNTMVVLLSAVQLYFISTVLSLLFVGVPFFHLDRSSDSFSMRWKKAMKDWREILTHKLDNFIEYQINIVHVIYITICSLFLFYFDTVGQLRQVLIFIYNVVLPVVFFYFKWSPEKNIDKE